MSRGAGQGPDIAPTDDWMALGEPAAATMDDPLIKARQVDRSHPDKVNHSGTRPARPSRSSSWLPPEHLCIGRPAINGARTPLSPQHFHRLGRILQGPCCLGASRQCKPSRFMKIFPGQMRRPSAGACRGIARRRAPAASSAHQSAGREPKDRRAVAAGQIKTRG